MDKTEFVTMAEKINKAKSLFCSTQQKTIRGEHHEEH
jgi:hypothetical protein